MAFFNPDRRPTSIDRMALERFYTSAICLDSASAAPHAVTVGMEAALMRPVRRFARRHRIVPMGVNRRCSVRRATARFRPATESVHWLADKGIGMFGVEAVSPAPEGELNFRAHRACAERGITHMECLANLEAVIGRGRFRFIGFPLRIRGGTGSPIRAVAVFE